MRPLSISEASERSGLTAHTLRYYERIGLLEPIGRNGAGHRRYRAEDLAVLSFLQRLRSTGMPIRRMQEYAMLVRQGRGNEPQRRAILQEHRQVVAEQLAELSECLAILDAKISTYRGEKAS